MNIQGQPTAPRNSAIPDPLLSPKALSAMTDVGPADDESWDDFEGPLPQEHPGSLKMMYQSHLIVHGQVKMSK